MYKELDYTLDVQILKNSKEKMGAGHQYDKSVVSILRLQQK